MKLVKYRRQYLITGKNVHELDDWQKETFNGMNVYAEQSLHIEKRDSVNVELLMLGYWINPHMPHKTNTDIIDDMLNECDTFNKVLHFLYPLSGRFALFCRFGEKQYAVADAGGFRPIYFSTNSDLCFSSNIYLLGKVFDLKVKPTKKQFETSDYYRVSPTFGWMPGYVFYEGIESVIANHYINCNERKQIRFFPNSIIETKKTGELLQENAIKIIELLKNSIYTITQQYKCSFALTAGKDSRLLLSVAKEYVDKMFFWISYNSKKEVDYFLPEQMLTDLNIPWHPIKNRNRIIRKQRLFYNNNVAMCHMIWQKYYCSMIGKYPDDYMVVRGSSSGTIKCAYYHDGVHPKNVDIDYLKTDGNFQYLKDVLAENFVLYLEELKCVSRKFGYNVLDLLQWENGEGGQWQMMSQQESDFIHDVFVPLSNREILDCFLQLPELKRLDYIYTYIIKTIWPELLNYPFNPPAKYSKLRLKLQYYKEATKFKLRKLLGC